MKEFIIGLLTKTLNKSDQEITDLIYQKDGDELVLKDGILDEVLSLDSVRVENIKKNAPVDKKRLENEFKRGQKETMEGLEKGLKEKYSFDSELQGIELIDEILIKKSKASKLSDDEVKKHPLYLDLEKNRIAKEEHEKVVKEFADYKNGIDKQTKFIDIKNKAANLLDEMKPIVSENPSVAKTRREDFLAKFEAYDYQIDGDNIVTLKGDGSRMEDGHGNPLPFNELVKTIAITNYDFPRQGDKGGSGGNGEENKSKVFNFTIPKNDDEYLVTMRNAKTLDEKVAIKEAYKAVQAK